MNVIPSNVVLSIVAPLLKSIDKVKMDAAINAIQSRYLSLAARPSNALDAARIATGAGPADADEDEDYEPTGLENTDQITNNLDQAPPEDADRAPVSLGPFNLPPPPPLTEDQTVEYSKGAVTRVFSTLATLDQAAPNKPRKPGFNRLAASNHDRDAWITVISRLATRAPAGLDEGKLKSEGRSMSRGSFSLNDAIRDSLYLYIIDDFRRRIDIGISWLNEEWYNDRIQKEQNQDAEYVPEHYEKWMLKILDGIVPFLDAKDKLLIRFLSEIPSINADVLKRVVRLAKDPERVNLAVQALQYVFLSSPFASFRVVAD